MNRSRYTEEQIIGIVKEPEAGTPVAELCRKHGMSDATFYTWKSKYGGLEVAERYRLCDKRARDRPAEWRPCSRRGRGRSGIGSTPPP
jgi:putative transposase